MRKARILLILGTWVTILPYLGFPIFLKNILFSLTGIGLAYFSYVLYREWKAGETEEPYENFSENRDFGAREVGDEIIIEENAR